MARTLAISIIAVIVIAVVLLAFLLSSRISTLIKPQAIVGATSAEQAAQDALLQQLNAASAGAAQSIQSSLVSSVG